MKRNFKGQFKRSINIWNIDNFNDGYIDNKGRFRIYLPSHHRSYSDGYVLRSIVVYELYNNDIVNKEFDIHHKDKNRLNDTKENLEKIKHNEHGKLHNPKDELKICNCIICSKEFKLPQWRINQGRGKFCSKKCGMKNYWKDHKSIKINKCLECNREFQTLNSQNRIYCSHKCSAINTWRKKLEEKKCKIC